MLPLYLEKDDVVAVGEIGSDNMTIAEEYAFRVALSGWQTRPGYGIVPGTTTSPSPYCGFRFPAEVIEHAVWLYTGQDLALRDRVAPELASHDHTGPEAANLCSRTKSWNSSKARN